MNLDFGFD